MLTLIWAHDANNGIGVNNQLPWHIKDEMKHFIATTKGAVVAMGRKTYESIGKPLPNRENIVFTNNSNLKIAGVHVYYDITQFLIDYKDKNVFIIGGKEIYERCLPYADQLIISKIADNYHCDTFFNPDLSKFKIDKVNSDNHEFSIYYYTKI